VEGGIEDQDAQMSTFAWIVIKSKDRTGKGRTGAFYLPQAVANLVRQGKELGEADDLVFGRSNSKQANGAVGILTGDVIDRTELYQQAVILALIPFKNPFLY
jgi:inosine/xanthosine triphosphatase